jgi:signal transduction histidine kinase
MADHIENGIRHSFVSRFLKFCRSLSGRLLVLTIAIVMLAEVLIYVPSIAGYRTTLLMERLEAAQIAVLALEARPDRMVDQELADELLRNAEVFSVVLRSGDDMDLFLGKDMPPPVEIWDDVQETSFPDRVMRAFDTLANGEGRVLGVKGAARFRSGATVEIVIDETPICAAMIAYSRNILGLSIIIALITASLIYLSLMLMLVRPMLRLTTSMDTFRQKPEAIDGVITPTNRRDEIGRAERQLAEMQSDVQTALQQKAHLAALGMAVSKINHDLKNILTSAKLVSDRIGSIEDPTVQRLAPKLFESIDRAVSLCVNTLRYGRAEEPPPEIDDVDLSQLVDDVAASLGLDGESDVKFANEVAVEVIAKADNDKLFRILLNLVRNAQQALLIYENPTRSREIKIRSEELTDQLAIDIIDNGPGIPDGLREQLFKPFAVTTTPGGAGLGLAIARDLTEAHGGQLALIRSGVDGTCFRVCLPLKSGGDPEGA